MAASRARRRGVADDEERVVLGTGRSAESRWSLLYLRPLGLIGKINSTES
jgi:hypothetical protein